MTLAHEGGYSDHPQDPGGPTNWGITLADMRRHVRQDASAADVRSLPLEQAVAIYRAVYWDGVRGDELAPGLDCAVFDYAVHSGIDRAMSALRAVTLTGPDTSAQIRRLMDERQRFLQGLPRFSTFGRGWMTRIAKQRDFVLERAGLKPAPTQAPTGPLIDPWLRPREYRPLPVGRFAW